MKKEKVYKIKLEVRVPFTINVGATTALQASSLAHNLLEDVVNWKKILKLSEKFESGYIDQYGEITTKLVSLNKY